MSDHGAMRCSSERAIASRVCAWALAALACAPSGPRTFEELDRKADRDLEACLRQAHAATAEQRDAILDACMRERDWVRVRRD